MLIVTAYRFARLLYLLSKRTKFLWIIGLPTLVLYRIVVEWFLSVEIPWGCQIGPGLIIDHGQGIVINKAAVLGARCRLRNGVVIGCKADRNGRIGGSPRIADDVDFGACSLIIGDIFIGRKATIGAGAVVVKDVPELAIMVGNPARILRIAES